MDFSVAPASGISNAQAVAGQPSPARVLTPGEIVEAKVLQILNDGRARLAVADTVIDVAAQAKLIPGATVRLAVNATPTGLKLVILSQIAPSGGAPASPPGGGELAAARPIPPGAAVPAASAADPATAVKVAAGVAANAATGVSASPSAAASAHPATVATSAAEVVTSHLPSSPQPATAALASAVQAAAARQSGLSPVFADASVAATLAVLPEPVRRAAQQLLALRPALDETISADTVKQAFQRSGLFLEARLAAAATGRPPANLPITDLKAALAVMREVLGGWLEGQSAAPPPSASPASATAGAAHAPSPSAQTSQPALLPPPYRGAPPAAQPAVPPSIAPDATPEAVGRALMADVDGALSRQTLLQAASLPDPGDAAARQDAARWNFEVPFALPQGTAVAQFEIARDGRGDAEANGQPVWRVRFSIAVEPIGPVHAQVALIGARAAVTLWAERPDTSLRLRDNSAALADALRAADFEASEVIVRDGTPPRPQQSAPSGRFLDRAS